MNFFEISSSRTHCSCLYTVQGKTQAWKAGFSYLLDCHPCPRAGIQGYKQDLATGKAMRLQCPAGGPGSLLEGRDDSRGVTMLHPLSSPKKNIPKNHQDGFILLEVVIALFIMGITFQGGLLFMTQMNQQKKRMETETKRDMVLRTLAAHALIHGRLPWAARQDASPESFGYEDKSHTRQEGILPFKTLGIAESYAKDGYGHYFTYFVAKTRPALLTVSPMENYCRAQAEAPLIHKDYSMRPREVAGGDARIDPGINTGSDFIAVALISHTSKNEDHESYALPNLPESTPDRTITWVTRDTLLTLYGQASCAPFHQPLPGPIIDAPIIPRGYGR
jgi:hypothetical protein